MTVINKKIDLELVGLDGNAFSIMAEFRHQAKKENWSEEEITAVLKEAQSGDYDNLLFTIQSHCN